MREGLRYEERVFKYIRRFFPSAEHNQWYRWYDSKESRYAYCCPDIVVYPTKDTPLLVFECKLTETPGVGAKLKDLYLPIVKATCPKRYAKTRLVQVAFNLSPFMEHKKVADIHEIISSRGKGPFLWNLRRFPK